MPLSHRSPLVARSFPGQRLRLLVLQVFPSLDYLICAKFNMLKISALLLSLSGVMRAPGFLSSRQPGQIIGNERDAKAWRMSPPSAPQPINKFDFIMEVTKG